ncbi:MAG: glycoside hydrolase family 31 protein [Deltaproteobacteria bacterium]|nr:MAG: glycoside hydrolase family 31 protein [Deltaproteobacteria bacterium]
MQMEYDSTTESGTNEMHFPVPLLVSTAGFGLFVDSYLPGTFDVLSSEPEKVIVTYGTGEFSGQGLDFHLFAAAHPLDVYRHYFGVTGLPALPAPWALGPWIWRDENDDQAQVESDARIIRELDLATCALWIDRPYASGVNSFDFETTKFPDPQGMVEKLHGLGFRLALWHTPYIDSHDPDTTGLYEQVKQAGYFPPLTGPILNNWSEPIDFTNPDACEFWQRKLEYYRDLGVEGYKLDYAEDVVLGIAGARMPWLFHDGSDERTMHSLYQLGYHRAYAEMLPRDGGFLLTRAGAHRDQAITRVVWPGDLDANMARHAEAAEQHGKSFVAVGGLPASVIYGLSLSASGYPFYGSDTGGYRHSPPDRETFTRWFEQTAFSTVMQVGTSTNDVPWEFRPENGFDEEMLGWYRKYARWHLRLWPYLWTHAVRIADTGRPIARPLGLAWPELGQHPDDQYMLGPDLLVAPVMERGARTKQVVFPPGRWFDFWTGELFEGDRQLEVDAPLDAIPVFQRAGTIIPLLRPTMDTLAPSEDPDVDSFQGNPGRLWLRAAPDGEGSLRVYDGTVVEMKGDGELRFVFSNGNVFTNGYVLGLYGFDEPPAGVDCDSQTLGQLSSGRDLESSPAGWYHDAERGWLYVVVEAGTSQCRIRRN